MPVLEARGLVKVYGRRRVVDGVDLEVNAGEVVGCLGPSGAGKTTTFRIIAGFLTPYAGKVFINGQDVSPLSAQGRMQMRLGHLPQGLGLPAGGATLIERAIRPFRNVATFGYHHSVEDEIRSILQGMPLYPSYGRKLTRQECWHLADEAVATHRLESVKHTRIMDLASGEQRRLEIARCLVREPLVLILDEPFTGIDAQGAAEMRELIDMLRKQGLGILLTDHNVREALAATKRSYLIKDGKIRTQGTPQEIVRDPIAISEYLGTDWKPVKQPESLPAVSKLNRDVARQGPPLLQLRGVVRYRKARKVVDDISITVFSGEIVSLVGPNDAGKTTVFQIACGEVTPDIGQVLIGEVDVTRQSMIRRAHLGMGVVCQYSSVFRNLTVEQNLLALLEKLPKSRSLGRPLTRHECWERTERALATFGLLKVRGNAASRLSGGERRRLEIARCLICEPSLILLDEPFTGLDPITMAELRGIIKSLQQQGIAVLFTDHNVREALKITTRCYLITQGKIRTQGTPDAIICDPVAISEYLGSGFHDDDLVRDSISNDVPPSSEPADKIPADTIQNVSEHEKVQRLIERLKTDDHAKVAADLEQRGLDAVPTLLSALERRDVEMRRQALQVLQTILKHPVNFDPYAPEALRRRQLVSLRSIHGESALGVHNGVFLEGRVPERIRLKDRVVLEVRISTHTTSLPSVALRGITKSSNGTEVLLVLSTSAFDVVSENYRRVRVFPGSSSDWTNFELAAKQAGVHTIDVTAYQGGAYLGNLRLQITIDAQKQTGATAQSTSPMSLRTHEAGEITLRIDYDDRDMVYRYLLIDGSVGGPYLSIGDRLKRTPEQAVEDLVRQLNLLARNRVKFGMEETQAYLKNKGIELWREFIPESLQRHFWTLRERIKRMIIVTRDDPVPWEVLYPFMPGHDAGFLVEQFPIARWVPETPAPPNLHIPQAFFVVSDGELPRASGEVATIRKMLMERAVTSNQPIQELAPLLKLFAETPFGLLHFACHNGFRFDSPSSSEILLGKQPFQPTFLEEHAERFRPNSPLVFMNACRTDGQAPSYTRLAGWARSFLAAGAGTFVGSLWEVRDKTAAPFAQEFYRSLLTGVTLGDALKSARDAIRDEPGDPTWLAYTLYGDPAARITWGDNNG